MARKRIKKPPMSQINVVPYIDVMLVLLVIFMITAPLLNAGVEVNLPQADAEPLQDADQEPLIVSVDAQGKYYLNVGEDTEQPVDGETLTARVAAVIRQQPKKPVLVRGDSDVDYGKVIGAMVLLQTAGASGVGLVTQPPSPAAGP
jgi:biopolymer transport protein TolR